MPSLHIAGPRVRDRRFFCTGLSGYVSGSVLPIITLMVIVGTANHFVIDAVRGLIVVSAGFGVQWLMSGTRPTEPAPDSPDGVHPPSWLRRPPWLHWPWERTQS